MFNAGFEKIAVSEKLVSKVIERHRATAFNNPSTGMMPPPANAKYFNKSVERTKDTLNKIESFNLGPQSSLKRNILKDYIGNYRYSHGLSSAKDINELRRAGASTKATASTTAAASASGSKAKGMIIGSLLGAGGLAAYLWSKKKKDKAALGETPEPISQVENNYNTPAHLERDPVYSLMMAPN